MVDLEFYSAADGVSVWTIPYVESKTYVRCWASDNWLVSDGAPRTWCEKDVGCLLEGRLLMSCTLGCDASSTPQTNTYQLYERSLARDLHTAVLQVLLKYSCIQNT
jgi:hypothetical protein